ncbi:DnrO protein [Tahibacter caeni]|uniref:DnrO protein n=1 Tax=Tahibacter caeni TaxID=1453545 RepID=UPI0021481AD5|nr:DnrO protein [Tahibacter caeni]
MNDRIRLFAAVLLCGATAGLAAAGSEPPHEAHAAHAAHTAPAPGPTRAPAQRWASDAALREGMSRVRTALAELHHYELGHLPPAAAQERAAEVEAAIRFLFANCTLAPDADAALHRILLPLLTAAQRLNRDPAQRDAVAAMREAVAPYPLQFDDPGWAAPAAAAAQ